MVGAHRPVEQHDMHMQVGFAAAVVMLREQHGHRPVRIPPLPRMLAVMAGTDEQRPPLGQADQLPRGLGRGLVDRADPPLVLGGLVLVPGGAGLHCGRGVADLQQTRRLGGRERQVVERHGRPGRPQHLGPGTPHLSRCRERPQARDRRRHVPGAVARSGPGHIPGRPAGVQLLPRRRDQLAEQVPVHLGVHLPGEAERFGALPGPLAGRLLPVLQVVAHGRSGRAQRVLRVMTCVHP